MPITRLLLLYLGPIVHLTAQPASTDSALAAFYSESQFTLPGGLPYRPGKGPRKRSPPQGSLVLTIRPKASGSPRRAELRTKRSDPESTSLSRGKHNRSQGSETSTLSACTLTPSQSPGPIRSLIDIRVDPRIPNDGRSVGIGKTLLPFDGEDLFSFEDIYFPLYAICSYHGTRV